MGKLATHQTDNPQTEEAKTAHSLTQEQVRILTEVGFNHRQIAALPNVRALTSEQIDLAKRIGALPSHEGELTLDQIAALPDEEIDLSDIPELTDEFWANAVLFSPKPIKEMVTIRLDADVLEYFRRPGPGYQTRINAVLRLWIKAHPNPPQVPNPFASPSDKA
jgi:uncharacterized protein (DUF4415 family)